MNVEQRLAMWNRRGYIQRGPGGCILWRGYRNKKGYGQAGIANGKRGGKPILVHKWLWEQLRGPVQGMLCHTCDNPNCIKLTHMYDGTAKDNARDWKERQRNNTFFPCGHLRYSNTYTYTTYRPDRPNLTTVETCHICRKEKAKLRQREYRAQC